MNTRIGDPAKLGRDCEIHQHNHIIYTFIICYIRMIVFAGIGWLSVGIKIYPHNKRGASQSLNAFQWFSKIVRLQVQMSLKKWFNLSQI